MIACIDDLPNLALSTQDVPTLSSRDWNRVANVCKVGQDVPVVLVWGTERDTRTAVKEIAIRAREAVAGVPQETRQALDDGTNGFERVLPGADRMYPDTDLPPIGLSDERVDAIRSSLPSPPWEKRRLLTEAGVGPDLAERLSRHRAYDLFEALRTRLDTSGAAAFGPHQLASLLLDRSSPRPASLGAAGSWWEETVDRLVRGDVLPEAVWSSEEELAVPLPEAEARRLVTGLAAASLADGGLPEDPARKEHALMGRVMPTARGRVPGSAVRRWIAEHLKETRQ
ncbi:MAG: hypothetical protein ABIK96_07345 [bacterium]